jgi:hypothetical protein
VSTWRRIAFGVVAVATVASGVSGVVLSAPAASGAASAPLYYISLGDSMAEGYQPGFANGSETLHGYANQVVSMLARSRHLTLENFGCGGATSWTMRTDRGCTTGGMALRAATYPSSTQLAAAIHFIEKHRGRIGLITIVIGDNDLGLSPLSSIASNIQVITSHLRAVAGPKVPLFGIGYPDLGLAQWLQGASGQAAAQSTVAQYQSQIDPMFTTAYSTSHVHFVDVATAFGTFTPLTQTVTLAPYGVVPYAVAQICTLTWKCAQGDDHPTGAGYTQIAALIVRAYRSRAG